MTEPNQAPIPLETRTDSQINIEGQEVNPEASQNPASQIRRSTRVKTLTEKGKEMQDNKVKGLQQRFDYIFAKWTTHAKTSKQALSQSEPLNEDLLNDIIGDVTSFSADVQRVYDELRQHSPPDQETRRKVDVCVQVSKFIVSKATSFVDGMVTEEKQGWPDVGSLFHSTLSKSCTSQHSSLSSVKRQEAVAEAAASQAVLKVLEQQEIEQKEIEKLEAEVRRKAAEQESLARKLRLEREAEELKLRMQREEDEAKFKAKQEEEYTVLQRLLDEKKRKFQHLEKVKDLRAAQAKMQYDSLSLPEEHKLSIIKPTTESKAFENVTAPLQRYISSQALLPREIVSGGEDEPYAQRTDLGWTTVGQSSPYLNHGEAICVSHRIIVRKVIPDHKPSVDLQSEVHYINRTKVRDVTSSEIVEALELDFSEKEMDDNHVSQHELKFLSKLKEGIKQNESGHYEMPLPFCDEQPKLPDNKVCAIHRLKCLKRRLRKNESYYNDYIKFKDDIISQVDAEKVPEKELNSSPVWYIPHHGVYHPHKPKKIQVVFNCWDEYQDTSLNDHLLTGPDLTNTFVGVLGQFCKGSIEMCGVEQMFHQFGAKRENQEHLCYLWWEQGNLDMNLSVYPMKVHCCLLVENG